MEMVRTRLIQPFTSGDTHLEVESTLGFAVGDVVVIDGQALRRVVEIGSLIIDRPLHAAYPNGTIVQRANSKETAEYFAQLQKEQLPTDHDEGFDAVVPIFVCLLGIWCLLMPVMCWLRVKRRWAMQEEKFNDNPFSPRYVGGGLPPTPTHPSGRMDTLDTSLRFDIDTCPEWVVDHIQASEAPDIGARRDSSVLITTSSTELETGSIPRHQVTQQYSQPPMVGDDGIEPIFIIL